MPAKVLISFAILSVRVMDIGNFSGNFNVRVRLIVFILVEDCGTDDKFNTIIICHIISIS